MRFYLASAIRPARVNIKLKTFLYAHLPAEFSVTPPYRAESGRMKRRDALPVMTLALLLAQPAPASAQWDCSQRPDGEWDCSASETPAMQPTFPAATLDAAPAAESVMPPSSAPADAPQPDAADSATDLDDGLFLDALIAKPEDGQVGGHFLITGEYELFEREPAPGLVVEHPPGRLHDLVGARCRFRDAAGSLPWDELATSGHAGDCASSVADLPNDRPTNAKSRPPVTATGA